MSAVTQCDTCRKIGPIPAIGWIIQAVLAPQEPSFMGMLSGSSGQEPTATFCTWRCAAEYAMVRALAAEVEGSGA